MRIVCLDGIVKIISKLCKQTSLCKRCLIKYTIKNLINALRDSNEAIGSGAV
jgi:hypothetical protein